MTEEVKIRITDAEWEVMRVVWTKGETTSQEIIEVLGTKMKWKPPTIKTLIGRLVKKAMLSTEVEGRRFIYRALVTEENTVRSATESLFEHICAKKVGATIAFLVEEFQLTHDDITLIMKELENKKSQALESIPCNCIKGQCGCLEHNKITDEK